MRVGDRSTNLILGIVTLVLSALVGLVISLASGGGASTETLAWTPPPATATHAPPAIPPSPTAIVIVKASPTPTHTALPTATTAPPTTVETTTVETASPTATPTEPAPTPTLRAPVEAPAGIEGPTIRIEADQLNLRTGPGPDSPVLGIALKGDNFAVIARNTDGSWLQACCFDGAPVWLAAGFGTLTGSMENVPIAEPQPAG